MPARGRGGRSQPANVLDRFNNTTTQLPIHGHKVDLLKDGDELFDEKEKLTPLGGT